MLCIAVTPTSRTLAKVDLLNAARRADVVELCLDHLARDPDVGELLEGVPVPVIVSCRREEHGGHYDGPEDRRLNLLRQAVIAGPAYIELDPDAAGALPRFGDTKRLIAHHSPDRPLKGIQATVRHAVEALHADVVKFTWPTPTLSAAWPLLHAVSQSLAVPVVGQGLGAGGLTFSLLALRFRSPWVYAALERGMEDFAGQPTVEELERTYAARDLIELGRDARFVAFAGFPADGGGGGSDDAGSDDAGADGAGADGAGSDGAGAGLGDGTAGAVCGAWNAAARSAGVPHRALPLEVGSFAHAAEMLQVLRVPAAVIGPRAGAEARAGFAALAPPDADAAAAGADVLLKKADGWRSHRVARRAAVAALAAACGGTLERKQVTLLGAGGTAAALGRSLAKRGANLAIADPHDPAAAALAKTLDARAVQWRAVYATHTDVLVRADRRAPGKGERAGKTGPVEVGPGPRAYNDARFRAAADGVRRRRGLGRDPPSSPPPAPTPAPWSSRRRSAPPCWRRCSAA